MNWKTGSKYGGLVFYYYLKDINIYSISTDMVDCI